VGEGAKFACWWISKRRRRRRLARSRRHRGGGGGRGRLEGTRERRRRRRQRPGFLGGGGFRLDGDGWVGRWAGWDGGILSAAEASAGFARAVLVLMETATAATRWKSRRSGRLQCRPRGACAGVESQTSQLQAGREGSAAGALMRAVAASGLLRARPIAAGWIWKAGGRQRPPKAGGRAGGRAGDGCGRRRCDLSYAVAEYVAGGQEGGREVWWAGGCGVCVCVCVCVRARSCSLLCPKAHRRVFCVRAHLRGRACASM
jgi:hypothetical protein